MLDPHALPIQAMAPETTSRTTRQRAPLPLADYVAYLRPRRIAKLLFGIVTSVVLAELGIAWWEPLKPVFPEAMTVPDQKLIYRMVPHFHGVMSMNSEPFDTNAWGLRDREYGAGPWARYSTL